MKRVIPFNIKYRSEIESGKYEVKTKAGALVKFLDWEYNNSYPIIAKIQAPAKNWVLRTFTSEGVESEAFLHGHKNDLVIITDEDIYITPKFNVGDKLISKLNHQTIFYVERIEDECYYQDSDHRAVIKFSDQNDWELFPKFTELEEYIDEIFGNCWGCWYDSNRVDRIRYVSERVKSIVYKELRKNRKRK